MREICVLLLFVLKITLLSALEVDNKPIDTNDVSPTPGNLDGNLREALLNALKELENEETQKRVEYIDKDNNNIVEKASTSALSIVTKDNSLLQSSSPSVVNETKSSTEKPFVLFQKSEGEHKLTISTIEEPDNSERFETSASSSFLVSKQDSGKSNRNFKVASSSHNLIENVNKISTRTVFETTTVPTNISTGESEVKAEHVQFFSAPLVAAFTVHQNELGLADKLEPIYKPVSNSEKVTTVKSKTLKNLDAVKFQEQLRVQQQYEAQQKQKLLEEEILRLNLNLKQQQFSLEQQLQYQQNNFNLNLAAAKTQEKFNVQGSNKIQDYLRLQQQVVTEQKQKALEEEIVRLNSQLKQQQLALQQQLNIQNQKVQQQNLLLQQEQLHLRAKPLPSKSQPNSVLNIGTSVVSTIQQLPTREVENFRSHEQHVPPKIINKQSVTFNGLVESGQLPLNAQILPIKGPVNFHASPVAQNTFQNFIPTQAFVQSNIFQQNLPIISNNGQRTRLLRQEAGVGNFVNEEFRKPFGSISIQKSIQPSEYTETTFLRHTINPVTSNHLESTRSRYQQNQIVPSSNSFVRPEFLNYNQQHVRNRFFRSNPESTFIAPGNLYNHRPHDERFGNLVHNHAGFRENFFH